MQDKGFMESMVKVGGQWVTLQASQQTRQERRELASAIGGVLIIAAFLIIAALLPGFTFRDWTGEHSIAPWRFGEWLIIAGIAVAVGLAVAGFICWCAVRLGKGR